jgi:hypothetical protein
MELPLDVIEYILLPCLYDKDILKYFIGDPETGNLVLKDGLDSPHLHIESQLHNIMELTKVSTKLGYTATNPLDMSFTDKIKFGKISLLTYPASSNLKRKLIYKIANKIKPSNTIKLYQTVRKSYDDKIRVLKYMVIQDIKVSKQRRFNFGNIKCLGCEGDLPLYQPSIKKYWTRAIKDGYDPRHLLKQVCSRGCLKKSKIYSVCACCHKQCAPGTELHHCLDILKYSTVSVNPETRESSSVKKIEYEYISNRLCSDKCNKALHRNYNSLNNKYLIINNQHIENPIGFVANQTILRDLTGSLYTLSLSITILNPNAPEFVI